MNFSELLDTLQKLKSGYKINQMSIANRIKKAKPDLKIFEIYVKTKKET